MSIVTEIKIQTKNSSRVSVYIDDEFFIGASLEVIIKNKIKKGSNVSKEQLEKLILDEEKQLALTKSSDYASKYVKTEKQLETYLTKKGFNKEVINYALEKLKEYGYINDEQFVKSYVNLKQKKEGIKKIKQDLFIKGISKELLAKIDELIENSEITAFELALKYMKNKQKTKENAIKLNRHLLGKGFDYSTAKSVINKIFSEDGENESWY